MQTKIIITKIVTEKKIAEENLSYFENQKEKKKTITKTVRSRNRKKEYLEDNHNSQPPS